jgi:hypothetical protein
MKTCSLLLSGLLLVSLTSCLVSPRARSPYSPGGRRVTRMEMAPRSPYSPGGRVVLPREARRVTHRGNVYYTHRGLWYRPNGTGYLACPRPY